MQVGIVRTPPRDPVSMSEAMPRRRARGKGMTSVWPKTSAAPAVIKIPPFHLQDQQHMDQIPAGAGESKAGPLDVHSGMLATAGVGHHAYAPQPTQGHTADLRGATSHGVLVPNMWRDDPRFEQATSGKKRRIVTEDRSLHSLVGHKMTHQMMHEKQAALQHHAAQLGQPLEGYGVQQPEIQPGMQSGMQGWGSQMLFPQQHPLTEQQAQSPLLVEGGLIITMQPAEHGRFRYTKEGRKTALHGRVEGNFPTIAVGPAFTSIIPDGTMVNVTIVTRHTDGDGNPVPHWHVLEGRDGAPVAQALNNGKVKFKNLVVNRNTFEVHGVRTRTHTDDQQVIRLMFEAHFFDQSGRIVRSRVISDPIYGSELKILKMSRLSVPSYEETEIFLLTSKIKKKNTSLKITDPSPTAFPQDVVAGGWQVDADSRPFIQIKKLYVHHQYAVCGSLPPFWDLSVQSNRLVEIRLVDDEHKQESPPMSLVYKPVNVLVAELRAQAQSATAATTPPGATPASLALTGPLAQDDSALVADSIAQPVVPLSPQRQQHCRRQGRQQQLERPSEACGGRAAPTAAVGAVPVAAELEVHAAGGTRGGRASPRNVVEPGWLLGQPPLPVHEATAAAPPPAGKRPYDPNFETFV